MATAQQRARPDVTVIVPMYNEEEGVQGLVHTIEENLNNTPWSWELLLVNDGSSDRTLIVAQELAINRPYLRVATYARNQGRGKALRVGFKQARGKFVVTIDADLSYHPSQIVSLIQALEEDQEADIATGSPYAPGGQTVGVPWKRLWISRIGNRILSLVFSQRLHTTTGIFRAYRRDALQDMDLTSDGKELHLEILSKALAMGCRVREVPAVLTCRKKGQSKFRFGKTAMSHLLFSVHERPMLLFGTLGLILMLMGFVAGAYVSWLRFVHQLNPGRPLMTVVAILVLGGMQIWSFGFIAIQIQRMRQEMYRLHRMQRRLIESEMGGKIPGGISSEL